jgi:hypothetical protein
VQDAHGLFESVLLEVFAILGAQRLDANMRFADDFFDDLVQLAVGWALRRLRHVVHHDHSGEERLSRL